MKFLLTIASVISMFNSCADAQSIPLPEKLFTPEDLSAIKAKVTKGDYGTVTSIMVIKNDSTELEMYFNGADETSLHNMRSASKSVTGMLLGAAIKDGVIHNVKQKAADFFTDLQPFLNPDARKSAITIEDLLTMNSPVECNDSNQFSRGNEERMYIVEDWSSFYWNLPIRNLPSWEIPDDYDGKPTFSYCTAGVQLLGEIVERATGMDAPAYAKKKLFNPIGITSGHWGIASSGQTHLGGGLELTTKDWGKLGTFALHLGKVGNKQIIPASWFTASFKTYASIQMGYTYGYLWWLKSYDVNEKSHGAKIMSGSGGNRVYVLPAHNLVFVISKTDFNKGMQAHRESEAFFENEIVKRLSHHAASKTQP